MKKTNMQKWLAFIRKNPPAALSDNILPEISEEDTNKTLITDSNGKAQWGTVAHSDIPLADDEGIMIYKMGSGSGG